MIDFLYEKGTIDSDENDKLFSPAFPTSTERANYVLRLIYQGPRYDEAIKNALKETNQRHLLELIE